MSCSAGRPPTLRIGAVVKLVKDFYRFEAVEEQSVKELPSYDDRNFYFRGTRENSRLPPPPGSYSGAENGSVKSQKEEYVLKLGNPLFYSLNVMKGINSMLNHLHSSGFSRCIRPLISREGADVLEITKKQLQQYQNDLDQPSSAENGGLESSYYMRVVTFIPGECLDEIEKCHLTPKLLYDVGQSVGNVDAILQSSFCDPAGLEGRTLLSWDLAHFLTCRNLLPLHDNEEEKGMAKCVLDNFEKHVLPKMSTFKKGIIYGDANGLNIIVRKNTSGNYQVVGLIDFGDVLSSYYVFDLGILLAYIMIENLDLKDGRNPIELVVPILHGFLDAFSLSSEEIDCLYYITMARCCQSALNGANAFKHEPWNTYLLITPAKCWRLIQLMLKTPKEEVDKIWTSSRSSSRS